MCECTRAYHFDIHGLFYYNDDYKGGWGSSRTSGPLWSHLPLSGEIDRVPDGLEFWMGGEMILIDLNDCIDDENCKITLILFSLILYSTLMI